MSHSNWCENREWQSVGTKALMNVSVWPYGNGENFDFSLPRFSTVDIYEKCGYGFGTINWTSFKTLDHPKRSWVFVHLWMIIFIGEIPWRVQQQKVMLIIRWSIHFLCLNTPKFFCSLLKVFASRSLCRH